MAVFGKWTRIVPGCEMPKLGEEVLVLLHDQGYESQPYDKYEVDLGMYNSCVPYIWTPYNELGGFDTYNDWYEGQNIKVIAWMPKPPARLED